MSKTRKNYSPEFKAQVVLQLLREENTVNELLSEHQICPVVIGHHGVAVSKWETSQTLPDIALLQS